MEKYVNYGKTYRNMNYKLCLIKNTVYFLKIVSSQRLHKY